MKIEAYYMDGGFEAYDSESHFNSTGSLGGANCMIVYSVHGDPNEGLWVRYLAYDVSEGMQKAGHDSPCAPLRGRIDVQVLDSDDMARIAWVAIDGQKRYFRLSPDQPLVDGFKFDANHEIYVGSKDSAATRDRAVDLYRILHGGEEQAGVLAREPDERDEDYDKRIAEMMGWDVDVLTAIVAEVEDAEWEEENDRLAESGDPEEMAEALAAAYDPTAARDDAPVEGQDADETPGAVSELGAVRSSAPAPAWAVPAEVDIDSDGGGDPDGLGEPYPEFDDAPEGFDGGCDDAPDFG
jgi:hypothetical protein